MEQAYDFTISAQQEISCCFTDRGITTFNAACQYIRQLPYGRNPDKNRLTTVFTDNRGTCSTKHAVLVTLARENNFEGLQLVLGIFRMDRKNTPEISPILNKYNLEYMPEAHNYLKHNGEILDFTFTQPFNFAGDVLTEVEITPSQITDYKVHYHKQYLAGWLRENRHIPYTPDGLWAIREECIGILAAI